MSVDYEGMMDLGNPPSFTELRDAFRDLHSEMLAVTAERNRAQTACEQMGARLDALRSSLLRITAIIETQSEPDIDALHDVAREALR